MKLPTTPPREVPMKSWNDFTNAAKKTDVFAAPVVVTVESSQQFRDLERQLAGLVRPFAVVVLTPK